MTYIKYLISRVAHHLTNYFKPLTVHTETVFIDEVWEKVKAKARSRKIKTWYLMTPCNYDLFKILYNTKLTKKKLSEKLAKRYKWLMDNGQNIELHIHLNKTMNITYKEQDNLFKESLKWMRDELNFTPKEFVPGWWAYNKDTLTILKKYNLKLIHQTKYRTTHDYNWAYDLSGMNAIN